MYKILRNALRAQHLHKNQIRRIPTYRTFLSQAYYCNEVWEHRLRDPIFEKLKVDEFYQDIDQRYAKTGQISAIDVDLFANAVTDESFVDELLDMTHKLRLSGDTGNTLDSTTHAIVRYLTTHGRNEELLNVLDDRLNYGLFLDGYTACLLLDSYYKSKDYLSGARVAAQLMLQEEFEHVLSANLALLHCYNFLLDPKGWPEYPMMEEPEEEVKIRVKYLRNSYDDEHFDLRDPLKIIGKTVWMINKNPKDTLEKSFHLIGLALFGKTEKATEFLDNLEKNNEKINVDILKLLPEDSEIRQRAAKLSSDTENVQSLLESRIKESERNLAEKDIALQCEIYSKWGLERKAALEKQNERLRTQQRLADVENVKKDLKDRETKLWFFEKEEDIELAIEAKKVYYPKRWFGKKKTPRKVDEGYNPPEV